MVGELKGKHPEKALSAALVRSAKEPDKYTYGRGPADRILPRDDAAAKELKNVP